MLILKLKPFGMPHFDKERSKSQNKNILFCFYGLDYAYQSKVTCDTCLNHISLGITQPSYEKRIETSST